MRKIYINTNFTTYNSNVPIKPKGSLWFIRNTGRFPIVINNNYTIRSTEDFGIDTTDVLIPGMIDYLATGKANIQIVNETEFNINFQQVFIPPSTYNPIPYQQFLLVETFLKIK